MGFRLTPRSMTLDDLELLKVRIFRNFKQIRQMAPLTSAVISVIGLLLGYFRVSIRKTSITK